MADLYYRFLREQPSNCTLLPILYSALLLHGMHCEDQGRKGRTNIGVTCKTFKTIGA